MTRVSRSHRSTARSQPAVDSTFPLVCTIAPFSDRLVGPPSRRRALLLRPRSTPRALQMIPTWFQAVRARLTAARPTSSVDPKGTFKSGVLGTRIQLNHYRADPVQMRPWTLPSLRLILSARDREGCRAAR